MTCRDHIEKRLPVPIGVFFKRFAVDTPARKSIDGLRIALSGAQPGGNGFRLGKMRSAYMARPVEAHCAADSACGRCQNAGRYRCRDQGFRQRVTFSARPFQAASQCVRSFPLLDEPRRQRLRGPFGCGFRFPNARSLMKIRRSHHRLFQTPCSCRTAVFGLLRARRCCIRRR